MSAPIGMNLGEARRRQARAKERRDRMNVDPDVRAARAALLEAREAAMAHDQAAVEAEQQARPDAVRAALAHASLDELAELQRVAGQLDGRRLAEIVGDMIRQRQRARLRGDSGLPVGSTESPARTRGRPKATSAA